MSIIGIIATERQTVQIKKEIEKNGLKLQLICINSKSIENIKNIRFEIVVIQNLIDELKEKQEYIKILLSKAKYLLLNADISINEDLLKDINVKILTYGLKQKSTITASSIEEKKIMVSIQRAFKNLVGKIIEQQEIPTELSNNNTKEVYNTLIKTGIINLLDTKTS